MKTCGVDFMQQDNKIKKRVQSVIPVAAMVNDATAFASRNLVYPSNILVYFNALASFNSAVVQLTKH